MATDTEILERKRGAARSRAYGAGVAVREAADNVRSLMPGPLVAGAAGAVYRAAAPQVAGFVKGMAGVPEGAPAAPAPAEDVFVPPSGAVDAVTMGQNNLRLLSAPPAVPAAIPNAGYKPMTAADIRGTVIPRRGTGAFVNNTTGAVTNFAPTPDAPLGAVPEYRPRTYIGALLDMKRGAMTDARAAKVAAALPALNRANAETEEINIRRALAAKYLEQNPTDFAGASVVFKGGALPQDTNVFLPTTDPNKIDVGNRASGAVRRVTPMARATEQTIKDTLATNPQLGGDRAKAIEALKNTGRYDTAGLR